jgi:hypothetical protein
MEEWVGTAGVTSCKLQPSVPQKSTMTDENKYSYDFLYRWIQYREVTVDFWTKQHILLGTNTLLFEYIMLTFPVFHPHLCVQPRPHWTKTDFVLGSMGQGIAMFLAGEMSRLAINSSNVFKAPQFGAAAASIAIILTFVFAAKWLTVP